jgi:hypothetical protein
VIEIVQVIVKSAQLSGLIESVSSAIEIVNSVPSATQVGVAVFNVVITSTPSSSSVATPN